MPIKPTAVPKPPTGASKQARALWSSIVGAFVLDENELVLLREAVATVDQIAELQADIDRRGTITSSSQGDRVNPSIVEARQQRLALARLISTLRLPTGDVDAGKSSRPQRRSGTRGLYSLDAS